MRWQDCEDDREKYNLYLCSREWAEKREAVRKRAGGICERCRIHPMTAVHHLTYARKYNELLEDLQANCGYCHQFTHGKTDHDPLKADLRKIAIYSLISLCEGIGDQTGGELSDAFYSLATEIEQALIVERGDTGLTETSLPEYSVICERILRDIV